MEEKKSFWKKTREFFSRGYEKVASPLRRFSAWAGGPSEKRNLFGTLLDLTGGLIKAPFKLTWSAGGFLILLVKNPGLAVKRARFQTYRVLMTSAALLGGIKVGKHWDITRMIIGFYAWMFSSIIGSVFIEAGMIGTGLFLTIAPVVIWLGMGLNHAIGFWTRYNYETWEISHAADRGMGEAQAVDAHRDAIYKAAVAAESLDKAAQAQHALAEDSIKARRIVKEARENLDKAVDDSKIVDVELIEFDKKYDKTVSDINAEIGG